jgi:CRISPR system Cascade subunit CasB
MRQPGDGPAAFVAYLEGLVRREDRAALAALRRGLGKSPGAVPEVHRHVVPWLGAARSSWEEDVHYLVASLFAAWHQGGRPVAAWDGSLGRSFRALADKVGADGAERRFAALLSCRREDLAEPLRHAVSLLRTHDVPVNWTRLLLDLPRWDHLDRPVQRRWARDFWAAAPPSSDEAADSPQAPMAEHAS